MKFGNIPSKQAYWSSQNLLSPRRAGTLTALELCKQRLVVLSDYYWCAIPPYILIAFGNPCGRKTRSLGQLFEFAKAGTTPTLNQKLFELKGGFHGSAHVSKSIL